MAAVISDASVLISLASVGHLELLRKLYGSVVVPGVVGREVLGSGSVPGASEFKTAVAAQWIAMAEPCNSSLVAALKEKLDDGEAHAIVLAIETPDSLLLMDESDGRAIARHFGVRVTGTIGVLVRAKQDGHLPALKPVLDNMIRGTQFRISTELYESTLRACGERS